MYLKVNTTRWNIVKQITIIIYLVIIVMLKMMYYIVDKGIGENGFFTGNLYIAILWISISVAYTVSPYVLAMIFIYKRESTVLKYTILALLIGNISLEVISMIGGTMCLDTEWFTTAARLFFIHISFLVLYIVHNITNKRLNSRKEIQ